LRAPPLEATGKSEKTESNNEKKDNNDETEVEEDENEGKSWPELIVEICCVRIFFLG
jgi:hypothetical protein